MRVPKHIGIIPDGNRRWAVNNNLSKEKGYDYGVNPDVYVSQFMAPGYLMTGIG